MPRKAKSRPKQQGTVREEKQEVPQTEKQVNKQEPKQEKQNHFSLYDLLEVDKDAKPEQIKKQYKKLVLKYHPDKNKEDPLASEKFQKLKEAYDILMNQQKRKEYDETGTIGEAFNEQTFEAAYNYFRTLYKKVNPQDIKSFEERYRHGEMQKEDLVNYYKEHNGDMTALIESIPLSTNEDIPRFIQFFEELIKNKQLPKSKLFDRTKGKVRSLKDEAAEFEAQRLKDMGALVTAIQGKSAHRQTDFIDELQRKYGAGNKKKAEKPKK